MNKTSVARETKSLVHTLRFVLFITFTLDQINKTS